jgi:hypothetical protein
LRPSPVAAATTGPMPVAASAAQSSAVRRHCQIIAGQSG